MRREDVRPLLQRAVDELPEPDLADSAWAGGLTLRRRRRRTTAVVLAVVLLMLTAAGILVAVKGPSAGLTSPDRPPSHPPGYVPPAGQIAGMDFWLAPPGGSEPFLDRLSTPMGEQLQYPDDAEPLQAQPVEQIAAVVLTRTDRGFRPLLLGSDAKWSEADVLLAPIATGSPLSPGSVAPSGGRVAFPQPGGVVVVESASAQIRRIALADQDIRSVSWLVDSERMLVSGPRSTYRVAINPAASGAQEVAPIQPSVDPHAATSPYRLDGVAGQVVLMRSILRGWTVDDTVQLPVQSWTGQTFTSGNVAARLFTATQLPQVPTIASRPQVVAAISAVPSEPSRLLVLGETPPATPPPSGPSTPDAVRERDCCAVAGWYDASTVLLQVTGWILSWNLETGQVRRVTEVDVEAVALGPGLRD
ncbi:hypothetical protein Kfla_4783 [Kribbella flavida DSM 17836]|uniref:Uncharacterized protein n=1 Tax=Kribbella flavida (strain DSM 17836 / JCM 10339 / NBRC 14399) TaxID=479435 RepID=D2Q0K0_KRIFD|nr:hypothetical protein [Kribbella flavida]ADB33800.1 hypothetical protein Kfla_4783 [Kribbella flavida DSM 17836]